MKLTDEGLDVAYSVGWSFIGQVFFKLETLQTYETFDGWDEFQRGDVASARRLMKEFLLSDSARPYEKIQQRNVHFQRVHVVELPLSDYMQFEILSYEVSIELGEEISFISKESYEQVDKEASTEDFLLFDDRMVIQHRYDAGGNWQGSELVLDENKLEKYLTLKNRLLSKALPMRDFLAGTLKNKGQL